MNFKLFSGNSILTPQDKKQRLMLVVLALTVLAMAVILYFGFWRSPTPLSSGEEPSVVPRDVIKEINFDANFLENPYLRNLKIYGEWPLQVGEKGRANPFLPY